MLEQGGIQGVNTAFLRSKRHGYNGMCCRGNTAIPHYHCFAISGDIPRPSPCGPVVRRGGNVVFHREQCAEWCPNRPPVVLAATLLVSSRKRTLIAQSHSASSKRNCFWLCDVTLCNEIEPNTSFRRAQYANLFGPQRCCLSLYLLRTV